METKACKDVFEKEGSDAGSVNSFKTRDENHPLHKPMVDHDQNRVKTRGERKIHDHVTRDLLEQAGGGGQDGTEPRDSWVCVDLVGLASSAASHKSPDKGGKIRPPVVALNQVNSAEVSTMSPCQGAVQGAYHILVSWFWGIETPLKVQGALQECPVITRHTGEEGGMLGHGSPSILNQQIGRSEIGNPLSQFHIQGTYQNIGDSGQHGNGGVVEQGVNLVTA